MRTCSTYWRDAALLTSLKPKNEILVITCVLSLALGVSDKNLHEVHCTRDIAHSDKTCTRFIAHVIFYTVAKHARGSLHT